MLLQHSYDVALQQQKPRPLCCDRGFLSKGGRNSASGGGTLLVVNQRRQLLGIRHGTHDHRLVAAADRDFVLRQRIGRQGPR